MKYKWLMIQFAFYKWIAKRLNQYALVCVGRLDHINDELGKIIAAQIASREAEYDP